MFGSLAADIELRCLALALTPDLDDSLRRIFQIFRYWRLVTACDADDNTFSKMEKRALFNTQLYKFDRIIYWLFA